VEDLKLEKRKSQKLYDSKEYSILEIVGISGISQATLYRYIAKRKTPISDA
jgi:hypothetical protein